MNVHCKDYREAIQACGDILLQSGAIESRYIDAMIECAEDKGPYFVLSKGFAIPHASTDRGVKEIGMSLIRLAEPIVFIDESVGMIDFVCCLSAVDADGHVNALLNLVNLLDNPEFREDLWAAETPRQIADVIRNYEEDL
jgi:mannitol/fructose-specific phosphotransferase system IIA component (Ntr-type)